MVSAMKWSWSFLHFCVFLLIFHCTGNLSCFEKERSALLKFKTSIEDSLVDPLLTWVDQKDTDCCTWERVKCSIITHRVIQLSLENIHNVDKEILLINTSLLRPFEELQHLDLSYNYINGWQNKEGLEKFADLKKLEVLNLQSNNFNNKALTSLGELSSLKTLDLSFNLLAGSLSDLAGELTNLDNLEVLDLSYNHLDNFLLFHDLRNMSKLTILNLRDNNFTGRIPPSVLMLKSLTMLSLRNTNLKDSISGFCGMKKLKELDLSENRLEGTIPPCLSNLTSLTRLDLSYNKLTGYISPSLISELTSLKYLLLSYNPFESTLFSSTNYISHKFQLNYLSLSNCNLNISTIDLLKFLYNQYDLQRIDLSGNYIHGEFPGWLIENNTMLETLILANNSVDGPLHFPLNQFNNKLRNIDLSNNRIQGKLQTNMGNILTKLYYLNLTNNRLEGRIPSSLGNLRDLGLLDLSSNNFSGEIPESLALKCEKLGSLILSHNKLVGKIYATFFNKTSLYTLRLNNNQLNGNIPNDKVGFSSLYTLDLSQNQISGRIPPWIGKLIHLTSLVLRDNYFYGPIPLQICNLVNMRLLDLAKNQLTGSLPSCQNLASLQYIHLQGNQLLGQIPKSLLASSKLLTLDLRSNKLSGNIPNWIDSLSNLRILLLKANYLSGTVPYEICRLEKIGILDLSHNAFSGVLPGCLNNMSFGKIMEGEPLFESRIFSGGYSLNTHKYQDFMENKTLDVYYLMQYTEQEEAELMTKKRESSYKGDILNFMNGMDLSSNQFTGDIPLEIGDLSEIRALNLSHNRFTGLIPKTLSNMKQLESLDLSYNMLSGEIPPELIGVYTLADFTVAYNNLSGQVPEMKAQFSTFTESSYAGNPFLCGSVLQKQCSTNAEPNGGTTQSNNKFGIDLVSFITSFAASYAISLLGLVFVLYINPYWRGMWFYFVDACIIFMFPKLFTVRSTALRRYPR